MSFIYSVGKYGVDVAAFESVVMEELSKPAKICIIDEIGKMETLFSKKFNDIVWDLLDKKDIFVLGTIALKAGGFIKQVKDRKGIASFRLIPFRLHADFRFFEY